jgi:hypothetical protein
MRHCVYRSALVVGLVLLSRSVPGQSGDKPPVKAAPGIEVRLRFSVETLDPLKPEQAFVECTVRNQSSKAVEVPTRYTGGHDSTLVLWATDQHDLRLVWWAGSKEQVTKSLAAGTEMTVFKALLKDVLLLDVDTPKPLMPKEERYYWSWSA